MKPIDFRSDTLTKPDDGMRRAMAAAEVGDDFYREDRTVIALEAAAAELLGKEQAMFVPSGTMGNLVSINAQVPRGSAIFVSENSHVFLNETGHLSTLCGLTPLALPAADGKLPLHAIAAGAPLSETPKRYSLLAPTPRAILIENTHNGAGGRCLDSAYLAELADVADSRSLILHMDGARLFNAAISLGEDPAGLARRMNSVTFCLSKGLGAPHGALVVGSAEFIAEARYWRQMLGGGMRQAGVMAAAGLHALRYGVDRLAEDHVNARDLAIGLVDLGLDVDVDAVETNIVMAYIPVSAGDPKAFHAHMYRAGVLTLPPKGNRLRFVTHKEITRNTVQTSLHRMMSLMQTAS